MDLLEKYFPDLEVRIIEQTTGKAWQHFFSQLESLNRPQAKHGSTSFCSESIKWFICVKIKINKKAWQHIAEFLLKSKQI
jgi:hypothetical protein